MKHRWIIVLALVLTLVAVWAMATPWGTPPTALADNGPHGGYTNTTDACSGCHRTHTAVGPHLLKSTSSYALCISCHNGAGANTDVVDGLWQGTAGLSLKGGGFTYATMNVGFTGAVSTTTSSQHKVIGMSGYTNDTVWGIGAIGSGAGSMLALECITCHDPHGKAGTGGVATYRILRASPPVAGIGPAITVPDVTAKNYVITGTVNAYTTTVGAYYGVQYPTGNDTDTNNSNITTISSWCATCHTRIHVSTAGSGGTNSGDAFYGYRHNTGGSNVSNVYTNGAPACFTCHVVHGTTASMGTNSSTVPEPGTAEGGGTYLDSSLLRVNNRGACEICHNK
ncbi:MAG: hypothetical protein M1132_10920 [Chloroflexi bacterium]|nr:hypothetical protein [Chloroflexota bacterium]